MKNKLSSKILNIFGIIYPIEKLNRLDNALQSKDIKSFYNNLTSHHEFNNLVIKLEENIDFNEFIEDELGTSKTIMKFDQKFFLPNDLMVKI